MRRRPRVGLAAADRRGNMPGRGCWWIPGFGGRATVWRAALGPNRCGSGQTLVAVQQAVLGADGRQCAEAEEGSHRDAGLGRGLGSFVRH